MVTRTLAPVGVRDDAPHDTAHDTVHDAPLEPGSDPWRRQRSAPTEIWHPWASRLWPATTADEDRFVHRLEALGGDADRFERRDVTALVTALRGGLTADELFEQARGLRPGRLLAAHRSLEHRRSDAATAWSAIVSDPSVPSFEAHRDVAATLLPVVVGHLASVALRHPRALPRAVAESASQVDRAVHSVSQLEQRLDRCLPPCERGAEIGSMLFDHRGEGAFGLGVFLPWRVGQLVPLRVAALLGETRPGARSTGW
jgi:hypothetical protein